MLEQLLMRILRDQITSKCGFSFNQYKFRINQSTDDVVRYLHETVAQEVIDDKFYLVVGIFNKNL